MNKFLKNILKVIISFSILYSLFLGGVFIQNFNHQTDYPAAIKSKYERLDSLKNTSKLIICGGSSSAYGIDSNRLSEVVKLPVVNTTLAMSLGSFFHLNLTKDYIAKGDIILYIPEYEFYYDVEFGDDFLYTTLFYYPTIFKDFTLNQKQNTPANLTRLSYDYYKTLLLKKIKKEKEKIDTIRQYNRQSYNYIGDNVSLVDIIITKIKPQKKNRYQKLKNKVLSTFFENKLKEFNKFCNSRGASLIIGFPPVETSQFDERFTTDIIPSLEKNQIKFLSKPTNYVYSLPLFYDSSYHLNGKGRKIRTEQLVNDLIKEL